MRSRLLLGGLCALVALLVAVPSAHADVFTGSINKGQTKKFSTTTDTSTIYRLHLTGNKAKSDLDIMVTTGSGDDEETVLLSNSAVEQLEMGTFGVLGSTEVTLLIINAGDSRTKYTLTIEPMGEFERGGKPDFRPSGSFQLDGPVEDPADANRQALVRAQLARKRGS